MTRKSKRELERQLDDLDGGGNWTIQDVLMLELKEAHDADLSYSERRLRDALDRGEDVLSPTETQVYEGLGPTRHGPTDR